MLTLQSTSTDDVVIRRATLNDGDTVYKFICTLEERQLDPVKFRIIYSLNVRFPTIFYFVAEQAGAVIGFVSIHTQQFLHECGKIAEIQELFVRPDRRGQGVGQKLLAKAMDVAEYSHCLAIEVSTNQKRTGAIRFYESESFNLSHYKLVKPIKS